MWLWDVSWTAAAVRDAPEGQPEPRTHRASRGACLAAEVNIGPGASGLISGTSWWTKSSGRVAEKGPCWSLVRQRRALGWEDASPQLLRLSLGLTPLLPRLLLHTDVPAQSKPPQELLLFFQPCFCLMGVLWPPQPTLQCKSIESCL